VRHISHYNSYISQAGRHVGTSVAPEAAARQLKGDGMQRTAINPWPWSLQVGYNQAEAVSGHTTQLYCAGQTAVDAEGNHSSPETWKPSSGWRSTISRRCSMVRE
jgi:predicted cobalt transporter CbtA